MKNIMFLVVCVFAISACICSSSVHAAVQADSSQVGRYQLFQGVYRIGSLSDNEMSEAKDVFKIDTITGRTWVYMTGIDQNQESFEFWREIEEGPHIKK